jgi:hypothetical protein
MTTFVLWGVFIAFFLLVVLAGITRAVLRRFGRTPQGPYRTSRRR